MTNENDFEALHQRNKSQYVLLTVDAMWDLAAMLYNDEIDSVATDMFSEIYELISLDYNFIVPVATVRRWRSAIPKFVDE